MTLNSADGLIFVSIASYRDPQLIPTVNNCIATAAHPERLRFGICWQHGAEQTGLPFASDGRFQILDVDWRDSRGACWARAEVMKLWQGEEWFLQVDSHCRFVKNWDERILQMMEQAVGQTGNRRAILSTYGTAFTPGERERLEGPPLMIAIQSFTAEGIPEIKPLGLPDWDKRTRPMRARFLGAGFLFTPGRFVEEVGYDPELYFYGEEPAMALRAFTSGYDLFHPHQTLAFHDYVRAGGARHWDNHTGAADAVTAKPTRVWSELDVHSRYKVKRLLGGQPVESYGLGSVRTLQDYEEYAGLSFSLRKIQDYTIRAEEPPNPPIEADWADRIYPWIVQVSFDRVLLASGALDDPQFWYVGIHDEGKHEIYRRDCPPAELYTLRGDQPRIALVCEFQSGAIPASWSVWPVSRTRGWLQRLEGVFAAGEYAVVREDEPVTDAELDGR